MTVANSPALSAEQKRSSSPFVSLRFKLLFGFTLLFFIVFAAVFAWFYSFASGVAEDRIREDLNNALVAASAGIDGEDFRGLYNEGERNADGYSDDPRYWEISRWLNTIHVLDQRSWAYTYVEGDEPAEVVYIASAGALEDPPWGVSFKDTEITTSGSMQAGLVEPTTFLERPYEWENRWWVSGYAPIRDSDGAVVGGLGIDYNFDYVIGVRNTVRDRAIPAFIIVYSALFVLVWLISSWFTRPIINITRVAERIAEGDYSVNTSVMKDSRVPDELTTLARVFRSMTTRVEQREEQLKERVAELEITLDMSKRDQQVSEIVESEFFQDLQSKARTMRERRTPRTQTDAL